MFRNDEEMRGGGGEKGHSVQCVFSLANTAKKNQVAENSVIGMKICICNEYL